MLFGSEISLKDFSFSQIIVAVKELHPLGYSNSKGFVENAKAQIFTYFDNWLKTGISNPKVTSPVERMMRKIKRRIKRIGYQWSDQGVDKMTRLVWDKALSAQFHSQQ